MMEEQKKVKNMGGTMRLGSYDCKLVKGTKTYEAYNVEDIAERHRHRFEFNNDYRKNLEDKGLVISGVSPDDFLVEIVELPNHPWAVGCQFHPEFKSMNEEPTKHYAAANYLWQRLQIEYNICFRESQHIF